MNLGETTAVYIFGNRPGPFAAADPTTVHFFSLQQFREFAVTPIPKSGLTVKISTLPVLYSMSRRIHFFAARVETTK